VIRDHADRWIRWNRPQNLSVPSHWKFNNPGVTWIAEPTSTRILIQQCQIRKLAIYSHQTPMSKSFRFQLWTLQPFRGSFTKSNW
jgi:hypothetical protein